MSIETVSSSPMKLSTSCKRTEGWSKDRCLSSVWDTKAAKPLPSRQAMGNREEIPCWMLNMWYIYLEAENVRIGVWSIQQGGVGAVAIVWLQYGGKLRSCFCHQHNKLRQEKLYREISTVSLDPKTQPIWKEWKMQTHIGVKQGLLYTVSLFWQHSEGGWRINQDLMWGFLSQTEQLRWGIREDVGYTLGWIIYFCCWRESMSTAQIVEYLNHLSLEITIIAKIPKNVWDKPGLPFCLSKSHTGTSCNDAKFHKLIKNSCSQEQN